MLKCMVQCKGEVSFMVVCFGLIQFNAVVNGVPDTSGMTNFDWTYKPTNLQCDYKIHEYCQQYNNT